MNNDKHRYYNENCISGAEKHLCSDSIDLIITDPPFGIRGDKLDAHYNRNEDLVIGGYVEVAEEDYEKFTKDWIFQAERVLRPGGSIYIVSGYTNLAHILNALKETNLKEVNHIIWKYNFGVYTKNKFVSSHYHILYYTKEGGKHTFNTFCRYSEDIKNPSGGSANYSDREDVWIINRDYQKGVVKNKNQLPVALLRKIIEYSSNQNDIVCDFFLGSFSTAKVAKLMSRQTVGFEINKTAFDYQNPIMDTIFDFHGFFYE